MNKNIEKIQELSSNIQNFLHKESNNSKKITNLENIVNKMKHHITEPQTYNALSSQENNNFHNFIRSGEMHNFVTKSLSSDENEAGVTITPKLSQEIINSITNRSVMRQIASIENISSKSLDIISEDGEFGAGWVAEAANRTETDTPKLVKLSITAHEIYAQPKATRTLINDAEINIANWLISRLSDSFTKIENNAFIHGDGNHKPFGLLSNNQVEDVGIAKDELAPLDLLNAINAVPEEYQHNISFLMNRQTLSIIQTMTDATGRFIWQQSMHDSAKQTIFGAPVYVCSEMPNIQKDKVGIIVGDFRSAYKIVDRMGINILRDPYTDKPFIRFYAVKRVGGAVVNPKAIKFIKF